MVAREDRVAEIRRRLEQAFSPVELEIFDESHEHAHHAGARDGRGHFRVRIRAEAFRGLPLLAQHRAVYAALGELMTTDIHAISIQSGPP